MIHGGKSHSGISGSKPACGYPEHIAACHALLQCPSQAIRQVAYHAELTLEPTLVLRSRPMHGFHRDLSGYESITVPFAS